MTRGWESRDGRGPGASWLGSSSPFPFPFPQLREQHISGWETWAETATARGQPAVEQNTEIKNLNHRTPPLSRRSGNFVSSETEMRRRRRREGGGGGIKVR